MKITPFTSRSWRRIRSALLPVVLLIGISVVGEAVPTMASAAARHPKFVVTSESQTSLGRFLATSDGHPLYLYTGDVQGGSSLVPAQISANWPALTLPAGDVLAPAKGIIGLRTVKLPTGAVQVTWQGLSLYTFVRDTTPDTATGQGKGGFVVAFVQLQTKRHS
jgi:predicted lipoprotein with Yx(FWY)xxD motif